MVVLARGTSSGKGTRVSDELTAEIGAAVAGDEGVDGPGLLNQVAMALAVPLFVVAGVPVVLAALMAAVVGAPVMLAGAVYGLARLDQAN